MNIFLIPSWYPHPAQPIAGCFTQEQARFYAELYPMDRMIVSVAGIGDFNLPLRKPQICVGNLVRYCKALNFHEETQDNFIEWRRPVLEWSHRFGGGLTRIISAHWKNFCRTRAHFGSVEVIHAHVSYPAGWIAMELSRRSGVPYIITEHMSPFPFQTPKFIRNGQLTDWIRLPLATAHRVVAVSPTLAERITSFGLKSPQVIPNVVDERCFSPENLTEPGQLLTFLTVGSMVEQKGIPDLLRAIAKKQKKSRHIRFRFAGDGPQMAAYRRLAAELGIESSVEWLGKISRKEMPKLFKSCHAFVLTSHHETFGIVYAEALACGKPIIATRCGGPESIVTPENGVLVNVGDIIGIQRALLNVIHNREQYRPEVIRTDFIARFSRPAVSSQLKQLYEGLLV